MQKITPFLWFDANAEEAVDFYLSLFPESRIVQVTCYGAAGAKASGREEGTVMTIRFELAGQPFVALNGGPHFNFSPAISFVVNCETQEELDGYWEKLAAGGETLQCGWLTDRFGVSWQLVPAVLGELLAGDGAQSERVMEALVGMEKLDIEALRRAAEQP